MLRKILSALDQVTRISDEAALAISIAACAVVVACSIAVSIAGCFRAEMPPAAPPVNVVACPAIAPLKPPPVLPDAHSSPCPDDVRAPDFKLAKCFDRANAEAAAADFDLLVKDRDYCRGEYARLMNR